MNTNGFSITKYHNTSEIYSRIDQLIGQPIRLVRRSEMKNYLDAFEQKYASSKPVIEYTKKFIPGGVQHNLAFNYPFAILSLIALAGVLFLRESPMIR